jgi:hypothetical protein
MNWLATEIKELKLSLGSNDNLSARVSLWNESKTCLLIFAKSKRSYLIRTVLSQTKCVGAVEIGI